MVSYNTGNAGAQPQRGDCSKCHIDDDASRVERAITWQYLGACSAPKVPNIRGLGGKDVPLHRVWEYRDIGRLFITVGGRESDNRGVEVGLVEVILRVSLEVILLHLLRQLGSHSPGEGGRQRLCQELSESEGGRQRLCQEQSESNLFV